MAKLTIEGVAELRAMLARLGEKAPEAAKAALYVGAGAAADAVRSQIQALPEKSGYMPDGQQRNVVKPTEKQELLDHLGIAPFEVRNDLIHTEISFAGYAESLKTDQYPNGLPIPLLARSIESGSSVRKKYPFMRKAEAACRSSVQAAMTDVIQQFFDENGG